MLDMIRYFRGENHMFEKLCNNIYRLCVPFEDLYTSVFLIRTDAGDILIDSADGENDVKSIILPALEEMNVRPKILALTHLHGDHAGGIRYLANAFDNAEIYAYNERIKEVFPTRGALLRDGDMLLGCVKALHLPGHSSDSIGFLDMRNNILIGGDAVQLYGISRYGCGLGSPRTYIKTLERLRAMPLNMYVASHDFVPLGAFARGEDVKRYFDTALECIKNITTFVRGNTHLSDEKAIAAAFTAAYRDKYENFPALQSSTVKAIIAER